MTARFFARIRDGLVAAGGRLDYWRPGPDTILLLQEIKLMDVKDSNGALLAEGDSVQLIKDLKVKGTSVTLKRGTVVKNIRLTSNEEEIEGRADKVKNLVLKTCFLKKV